MTSTTIDVPPKTLNNDPDPGRKLFPVVQSKRIFLYFVSVCENNKKSLVDRFYVLNPWSAHQLDL